MNNTSILYLKFKAALSNKISRIFYFLGQHKDHFTEDGTLVVHEDNPYLDMIGFDLGGGEIYHYKKKPFTGILKENYSNGTLCTERHCVNGYPEGLHREYYKNGQLMEEFFITHNLLYGIFKKWDEDGNLIEDYDSGPKPLFDK